MIITSAFGKGNWDIASKSAPYRVVDLTFKKTPDFSGGENKKQKSMSSGGRELKLDRFLTVFEKGSSVKRPLIE